MKFKLKKLKRKFLKFSGTVITATLLSIGTVKNLNAQFSGGSGTEIEPYLISSVDDMEELADSVSSIPGWSIGLHFLLMNDIDTATQIIGTGTSYFQGFFNGNYKKVVVFINGTADIGLFGFSSGIIENLTVEGTIGFNTIGGIVGRQFGGEIRYCVNNADINNKSVGGTTVSVGGIVGNIEQSVDSTTKILNCTNNANLTSSHNGGNIGGIVGFTMDYYVSIENCCNTGNITGLRNIGGIVGYINARNSVVVLNCVNSGSVYGQNSAGGIVGYLQNNSMFPTIFKNCLNIGTVKIDLPSPRFVWGFAGGILGSSSVNCPEILNSTNKGLIVGDNNNIGGIFGGMMLPFPSYYSAISNNFNSGVVIGTGNVGCIVGNGEGVILINNHYDKQMCGEED